MKKLLSSTYKSGLFFALIGLFINGINAQSLQWSTNMGAATKNAAANKITVDAATNAISVGFFGGTTDFDPGAGTANLIAGGTNINGFVQKLTTARAFVWAKGFLGTGMCNVNGVATDASSNVYVTGNFNGAIDFDPGAGVVTLTTSSATNDDIFIVKLTSAGNFAWVKQIGSSTYDDIGNAITVDGTGNVFVGGNLSTGSGTNVVVDIDPGAAVVNVTTNSTDGFVLKLDNNGNYLTSQIYGGNFDDALNDIETDATGNVYVVGSFYQSVSSLFTTIVNDYYGAYTAKLTNALVKVWSTRTNSPGATTNTQAHGIGIEVDASGNVYYSGDYKLWVANSIDFDSGASTAYLASASTTFFNGFVSKLNSSGALVWVQSAVEATSNAATNGSSTLNDISLDGSNNLLCTGTFTGSVDFDPTTGTYYKNSAGARDYYITKIDQNGNFYDVQTYGSTGEDRAYGIKAVGATAYYLAGLFTGTVDFSSSVTTSTIAAIGTSDAFVAKYAPCSEPSMATAVTPTSITICAQTSTVLAVSAVPSVTVNWYNAAGGGALLGSGNNYTTSAITTTISLWAEATNTCGAAARVRFIINTLAAPVTTLTASSSTLCAGSTITLTAGGALTYSWSTGATTTVIAVSPTISTQYTVTGTGTNSCKDAFTFVATVITPTVSITASSSTLCSGSTTSLTASGASTYSWNTGATTTVIAVSPTITTVYTATGTSTSGCKDTQTISIVVSACTGVTEVQNKMSDINLYPNPITNYVSIGLDISANLQVTDVLGKIVLEKKLEEGTNTLNISDLSSGMYYFCIMNEGRSNIKKVIKN